MITQSDTIGKIVEALCKAQMKFDPIIKDVKAHQHKFAPLPACYNSTRKALCDNGLTVIQPMNSLDDGRFILETILGHISGEFFKSYTDLTQILVNVIDWLKVNSSNSKTPNSKTPNPLHTWGSIITYTRRYAYLSIIGAISEDEDNDGDIHIPQKNGNDINQDYMIIKQLLIKELSDLIKISESNIEDFTKFHNISSKDILCVKKSIDNFDELLIEFKKSNMMPSLTSNPNNVIRSNGETS